MSAKISATVENSIQVCIKVRPSLELCPPWQVKDGSSIQHRDSHAEPSAFDHVFDGDASNQEVFDRMGKHVVHACMQGFNGTIFSYGQSTSGKTYTMVGDDQNPGVMVLAAKEIFEIANWETKRDFLLRATYIEIYNEKINDLLKTDNKDLKLHEPSNGVLKLFAEERILTSEDDLVRLIYSGNKERTSGGPHTSERSPSKAHTPELSGHSHAILRITIESWKSDGKVHQSMLSLVDLAGSEKLSGSRVTAGVHINKSLMFLNNVVKQLSDNGDNKYICFRDSKLTRFLQSSLSGNAFTSIICTVKSSDFEESQTTLNFATRAMKIRINPQLNKMKRGTTLLEQLENDIKELQDWLTEEKQKSGNQLKVQTLEKEIKAKTVNIIKCHPFVLNRRSKSSADTLKPKTTDVSGDGETDKDTHSIPKCDSPQAEDSALTASKQLHKEQVKTLKQIIARLEMENTRAVKLKQKFDSHKVQSEQTEFDLRTTIINKDLTIEELQHSLKELSRDVVRVDNMQAEYQVIQKKYNKLQGEYESLERTSNASEEQCQKLQTDNTRLQLEIGTLKERVQEAKRMLLEAPSQEVLAEEFKVKRECQTEHFEEKQIKSETPQANATDGIPLKDTLKQEGQEQLQAEEKKRLLNIISQLEKEVEGKKSLNKATEATNCTLQNALSENKRLVSKVQELQRKIEYLEKQKDEAHQGTVSGESTMDESMLQLPLSENTLVSYVSPVKPSKDVIALRATVAEANAKVCELQTEKARQLKEIELKDSTIAQLKNEIDALMITQMDEKEKLASSEYKEQIEGLKKSLRKAKVNLKSQEKLKTDEINALRHEYLVKMEKSENENRAKFDEYSKQIEKSEQEVATWKESLLLKDKLQETLRAQLDTVSSEHNELAASSKEQIQELKQKYEQMAIYTDNLREEKSILQVKIDEADVQHSSTLKKIHELEMQIDGISKERVTEKSDFKEKLKTMTAKIGYLKTELQSARRKAASLDGLISEHENLKLSLSEAKVVSSNLEEKVDSLQSQLLASEKEISSRDVEKENLCSQLKQALEAKETASEQQLALATQLQEVKEEMASQVGKFEKELKNFNSCMDDVLHKLKSLQEQKNELESENTDIKVKLKNAHNLRNQLEEEQKLCASLRTQFTDMEVTKTRLEEQLANKEAELNRKLLEMSQNLETKTNSFQKEKDDLNSTVSTLSKEKKLLEEKIDSLNLNDNRNAELIAKLKTENDNLNSSVSTLSKEKKLLDEKIVSLNLNDNRNAELIAKLKADNENLNSTVSTLSKEKKLLEEKIDSLKLNDTRNAELIAKLKAENEDLNSTVSTLSKEKKLLEAKISSLNNRNTKLIAKLKAKEAEFESLRQASDNQKLVANEANIKCTQYMDQKVELKKEVEWLQTTLKSKETSIRKDRESMNATISSLLEDKRNLEEKQCTLDEKVEKLENELSALQAINRCNSSVESNDALAPQISVKPRTPNSKPSAEAGVAKKSGITEHAVRREKRNSAHDEHRMQSYWDDLRDFGTMTDPEEDCLAEKELDLKKNPLKAENKQLRFRMFKQHKKATIEQKRQRRKIHDLTTRIASLTNPKTVDSKK